MDLLPMLMIIVAFLLGVFLVLVAVVAFFKNAGAGGEGSLKLPGGIEITGKGAAVLFLFVGASLVFTGAGWASSQRQVERKEVQLQRARVTTDEAEQARQEAVADKEIALKEVRRLSDVLEAKQDAIDKLPRKVRDGLSSTLKEKPEPISPAVLKQLSKGNG